MLNCLDTGDERYMSRLRTIATTSKGQSSASLLSVRLAAISLLYGYLGKRESVCGWCTELPAVLEPQLLTYFLLVEPYDDLAVYDGGRGGLGVHLDHLLHCIEVGTDILLDKIDVSLR